MKPYNQTETKEKQIREMFNSIAPAYDRLCHLLSFNIDRRWRKKMVKTLVSSSPSETLDIATGTGDIAIMIAERDSRVRVTGIDISERMMEIAGEKIRKKSLDHRIALQKGNGEHLAFGDNTFDAVSISFGIRNFEDIDACMKECLRVLRPGKAVYIMEFATPENRIVERLYRLYSRTFIPAVGKAISKDEKAYVYLPESIVEFLKKNEFLKKMEKNGFGDCRARSFFFGIANLYIGYKKV